MITSSSSVFACTFANAHGDRPGRSDAHPVPLPVADVLRSTVERFDESRWVARRLAEGRQARLFSVRAGDGMTACAGEDDGSELVVKLYRASGPDDRNAARDEFECLARLHSRLNGTTHDGWNVRCPRPLHFCDRLAALVMTRVPGRTLTWHLAREAHPAASDLLVSIPRAIVSALRCYWVGEPRLYGDLILNNILCDPVTRSLSFVDPGMPERFYLCESAPLSWYPASRDLGFLLFWTASLIRPSIAHPVLHARQKLMAAEIVRSFLDGLEPTTRRLQATGEIEACARLHVDRMAVSASPRGMWRRLVKCAAAATIARILDELRRTSSALARSNGC